jgi:hypothetical protein
MSIHEYIVCLCITLFIILSSYCGIYAQKADSTRNGLTPAKNKYFLKFLMNSLKRSSRDSSLQPGVLISKNEALFLPYEGKGIRHILVRESGFDKTLVDTAHEIHYFGKKIIQYLHRNTREWVIRNNLFIQEKTALNAHLVADNERHLRSLEYIHDARILIAVIADEPDSIDLVVITKDFLSITVKINDVSAKRVKASIGDVNLFGTANKVQFTTLIEKTRSPQFGYEIKYRKNSIANTFMNATIGYSNINSDLYEGTSNEQSWHAEIERPLVSQYLKIAGAVRLERHQNYNYYLKEDSLFYSYHYNTFDAWIGYNLGVRKFLLRKHGANRQFVSIRYFRNKFKQVPYQPGDLYNFKLNEREAVLAQFTFFRQNFYKTNYIFGFGITEDVPYGYNFSLTTGWYRQLRLERMYAGAEANMYVVNNRGNVVQYFMRTGAFLNKRIIQDAIILTGISAISRVYSWKHLHIRQYLRFSYTKQFNRIGLDPLGINNIFGLHYISSDSATGNQRISLHTETIFFLDLKVLGFKFAPFASADFVHIAPEGENTLHSGFYYGLGGGLRARNENILFGTLELRFMYFPRKTEQYNAFKLTLAANLRLRYNSNYVIAPDIIQVNSDRHNNIF